MKKTINDIFCILNQKEKTQVYRFIFLDVLVSLLDIVFLAVLIYVINFYTATAPLISYNFFALDYLNKHPLALIVVFFLLFAIKNAIGYLIFKSQYQFVYKVAARLSKNNLLHYLQGSFDDHVQKDSAVFIRTISQQPIQFGHHILGGLQQIVGQSILILITIIAILIYSPVLFLFLFLILTPALIILGLFIRKKLNTIRQTAKPVSERSLQHLKEALAGYVESNIYQRNHFFTERYHTYQSKFNDFLSSQLVVQQLPSRFMEVFALFGLLLLIVFNFYTNNNSIVSLITIGAFMAAAYKIIPGTVKILNSLGQVKTFGYVIPDLLQTQHITTEEERPHKALRSISMDNISFSYNNKSILSDFSFQIKSGEMIGLSGSSGKGKTTVINLLLGFLEEQNGNIKFNDDSTTKKERQAQTVNIAYVKQDTFLLHDTVRINVTLSEDVKDNERLNRIAEITGLQNLDALIAENGKNISGGQRQRIAIARALYKNADLVMLDEPFNELDSNAELKLLQHFQQIAAEGKMIILITHNKESLSHCNKIVYLDE